MHQINAASTELCSVALADYRALNKQGKTVDFVLTATRDMATAKRLFAKFGADTKVNLDPIFRCPTVALNKIDIDRDRLTLGQSNVGVCAKFSPGVNSIFC